MKKTLLIFTQFFIVSLFSFGQFVENKGQVLDFEENFHPEVKYYHSSSNAGVYFQNDRVVYNFIKVDELDKERYANNQEEYKEALKELEATYYRMDLVFQNANSNVEITSGEATQGVTHFYLNKRNGIRDVKTYSSIQYNNVYPNIDVVFHTSKGGMKYDIVLREGANIDDVQLKFEGFDVRIEDKRLIIPTEFGDITEEIPLSFLDDNEQNTVDVEYVINKDGSVGFKLKKKVKYSKLTIDPVLEWATYFNQSNQTGSNTIEYIRNHMDDDGNYYTYGYVWSNVNSYPVVGSGGAYTSNYNANRDIYLAKFNTNRQLVWGTYLGGSGGDSHSWGRPIVTHGNTLHIVGEEMSTGAPFTNGGGYYSVTNNYGFWGRFNKNTGALEHLTSIGRIYDPSIAISNSGIVAIIGDSYDWGNLPTMHRAGAYNQPINGGYLDMALLMFNSAYNQIWGTFLGGPSSQEGFTCAFDNNENLYFAGGTTWLTASNPTSEKLVTLSGAYNQSVASGGENVTFGKFNSSGQLVWHSLYGGNGNDARIGQMGVPAQVVIHPTTNELILAFNTTSDNLPVQTLPGAYNRGVPSDPDFGPGGSGSFWNYAGYIAKFSPTGVRNWGTYFYGDSNTSGTYLQNIIFGGCDKLYIGAAGSAPTLTGASSGYNLLNNNTTSRNGFVTMLDATNFSFEWDSYLNSNHSLDCYIGANLNQARFFVTARTWYENIPVVNPGNGAYYEGNSWNATSATLGIYQFHPSLPPNLTDEEICEGGSVTLNASGGMGAPYNWYSSSTGGSIIHTGSSYTVSPSGTTTYYVSSGTGVCASPRAPITVNVTPGPNAGTISGPNSLCVGNTITLSSNGDGGGAWTTSNSSIATVSSSGVVTGVSAGTVTISYTVSGTAPCPNAVVTRVVTVNPIPSAPAAVTPQAFCGSATVADLIASGSNLQWYNVATGGSPLSSGTALTNGATYYVSQTVNGCESPRTPVSVIINPIPAAPSAPSPQTFCGSATVANLTATGANIQWYAVPTGGSALPNGTSLTNGSTYYVSQTVNGCESARTPVTVTITPIPSAPTASNQSFCGSATVADLVPSGAGIQWYSASTGGSALSNGTSLTDATTYYASQTVGGCESARTAVTVTVTPIPAAPTAPSSQAYCGSATVADLTATGGSIQWYSTPTGGVPLLGSTALASGSIYYASQTVNGCEGPRVAVAVFINPIPSAPAAVTPQSFCGSATVADLTATGSNLQWYAAATGGSPLSSGTALTDGATYYVSQTVDGCESSRTAVTVTIATPPVAGTLSGNQTFCAGTSSAITNTGGDAGGTWSSDNTGVATVNSSGVVSGVSEGTTTITYTVLGTSGCPDATATIIVTVTPSVVPSVTISGDDVSGICAGSTVNLTASPTNGGTNPTYQWQINGVDVVGETGTTFSTSSLNDDDIVTVVMVSDDPCANPTTVSDNTVSVGIVANVTPSVSITGVPTEEVCAGESITFTANPTFGGANPTYQWQVNGTDVAGETGTTFTTSGLNDGDVVSVILTSDDPCANPTVVTGTIGTEGISIGDSEAPVFSECPADITVSSGNSCDASVTWTAPTVTDNCTTTPTLTSTHNSGDNFPVGTTVVTYTAEDDEGNIGTCSFNIIVVDDEAPVIVSCISDAVLFSDASCETIVPDFTVDAQLEITDNCSSVADGTLTITQNPAAGTELGMGTHTVEITVEDAGGNTATCSFELVVSDTTAPVIDIDYSPAAIHCAGNEVTWTENITDNCGVETVTSTHQSGDTFPVGTTTVTYTATDASGNESTYSFDVVVGPSPNAPELSGNNFTVCYGKDITLSIDNYDNTNSYSWIHSGTVVGTGSTHEVESSQVEDVGIYTVIATSPEGCVSSTEVELSVNQCEIVISGGISPNGDGLNDVFEIGGIEAYPKTEVWIYNRWGAEVYHSEDYKNDWDGTSQSSLNVGGNELPEGTYYYVIRLGGYEGQLNAGETYKGYVYLKR